MPVVSTGEVKVGVWVQDRPQLHHGKVKVSLGYLTLSQKKRKEDTAVGKMAQRKLGGKDVLVREDKL